MTENKSLIKHTFFLTDKQQADLLEQAEMIGVNTVADFIDKAIYLAKIYAKANKDGHEFLVVERKEVEILEDEEANKIALVGPKESFVFITDKLNEAMQIHKQIQGTNSFGMPIDEWLA